MFKTLDPGGKIKTLHGPDFYEWSLNGQTDANFRYAVAMLPTANEGHAVSIVRSKRADDNRLILIDSNIGQPKLLSTEATKNPHRWRIRVDDGYTAHPLPYVMIYEDKTTGTNAQNVIILDSDDE